MDRVGVKLPVEVVAERLQRHGWLLPLRTRGAWEFAPGSRAGPFGSGDPFIELRARLARRRDFPAAVAYESAVWLHNLSDRSPDRHVLSIPKSESVPHSLRGFRVTRIQPVLDTVRIRNLPVWSLESLVVLIGARPTSFGDWPNLDSWFVGAARHADPEAIVSELAHRSRAAWMRTGYLLEWAANHDLADRIRSAAPAGSGPFYLGARDRPGHYSSKWQVMDSLLVSKSSGRGVGRL
ncbi:MAG: type IV toxin-antitoxin system AbiEi family antitoxin [Acidimicrobiia bacterium]